MGWLRIMRPGSVIGEQQHYLCAVERAGVASWAPTTDRSRPAFSASIAAEQVAAGMAQRSSKRSLAGRGLQRSASEGLGRRSLGAAVSLANEC